MEKIPTEWIDKLFDCMELFYEDRWRRLFKNGSEKQLSKEVWKSGLVGLNHDKIKNTLALFKRASQDPRALPPHVMEFYRHAITQIDPTVDYHAKPLPQSSIEVANEHIANMKARLRMAC